jgi:toxin ParE1/3/4
MAERIEEAVSGLSSHPELGRPGRVPQTRELIVSGTPYIVPYRIKEDVVEILTVLHAARRWPDRF